MNVHYDLAKAELATRLRHADSRRADKLVRRRHNLFPARKWRRGR
jgi:hypothetical protein